MDVNLSSIRPKRGEMAGPSPACNGYLPGAQLPFTRIKETCTSYGRAASLKRRTDESEEDVLRVLANYTTDLRLLGIAPRPRSPIDVVLFGHSVQKMLGLEGTPSSLLGTPEGDHVADGWAKRFTRETLIPLQGLFLLLDLLEGVAATDVLVEVLAHGLGKYELREDLGRNPRVAVAGRLPLLGAEDRIQGEGLGVVEDLRDQLRVADLDGVGTKLGLSFRHPPLSQRMAKTCVRLGPGAGSPR